jgi:multiple sugar transport system substrate-binding protein
MIRSRFFRFILIFLVCLGLSTCTHNTVLVTNRGLPQQKSEFRIWWSQGFLPEENEVIAKIKSQWEKETGLKAELRLIPNDYILDEAAKAVDKGTQPDVLFSVWGDTNLFPLLAWKNQLADVSDLIEPLKKSYSPIALQSAYYQNKITEKRSYYAVPLALQAPYIHYWRNMLEKAGLNEKDIPKEWEAFWKFWQQAQVRLRQQGQQNIYGIGFCMSDRGTDTYWEFEHFLQAYNVKVVDEKGQLLLDNPDNRRGIVKALREFSNFYKEKYVPEDAVTWTDSGNNSSLLNGQSLMTVNNSMSIPLSQKQEQNVYNKLSTDIYFNKMATTSWPLKPDQRPIEPIANIKQAVIFEASVHKDAAKSFLSYLLKPENLNQFLKEAGKGRLFPAMPKLLEDSFWNSPADPHMSVAAKQYQGPMQVVPVVFNPAYSEVMKQNIWAKAVLSIIQKGTSPEDAAEGAIAQIQQIFSQWK